MISFYEFQLNQNFYAVDLEELQSFTVENSMPAQLKKMVLYFKGGLKQEYTYDEEKHGNIYMKIKEAVSSLNVQM